MAAQIVGGCLGTLAAHGMFDLPLWLVTAGLANEVEAVNQYAAVM